MNIEGAAVVAVIIVASAITVWGIYTTRVSLLIGMIACVVALVAGTCAWHAWMETNSLPWTTAYVIICLLAVVSAVRQFIRSGSRK